MTEASLASSLTNSTRRMQGADDAVHGMPQEKLKYVDAMSDIQQKLLGLSDVKVSSRFPLFTTGVS